jgi:hypothetical protein
LATVSRIYKGFTQEQEDAWNQYAQTLPERDPVTGKRTVRTGVNAFTGLATKFLQATPGGSVPLAPPSTPFVGDAPVVTATAGVGKVTFSANVPNGAGVTTELLLQPLASRVRNPQKGGYRTKAFFRFVPGSLSTDVTVPPGFYAAAYRFVRLATGQTSDLTPIGVSQVTLAVSPGAQAAKKKAA